MAAPQVKKLQAPQKQLEAAKKPKKDLTPNAAKPARAPKKPKREANIQDGEDALRLKVISTHPAVSFMAQAISVELLRSCSHRVSILNDTPKQITHPVCEAVSAHRKLRRCACALVQAEGAAIAAAVFASVSQAAPAAALPDQDGHALPDGQPGRPKARVRKPKKKPDASPEEAEEALRMKAEAARIAAEAFAVAPQARTRALCFACSYQALSAHAHVR